MSILYKIDIVARFLIFSRYPPGVINPGRQNKQQIQAERSCTDATLTEDPEFIQLTREYPCDNGNKKVTAFPSRDIVYKQDNQLFGLRDKPITQQDGLPKSEGPLRYLPGQDPLSLLRHPFCHPT
ncbi:hypothetical protein GQ457_03G015750 [Hibiscus cannabinus]